MTPSPPPARRPARALSLVLGGALLATTGLVDTASAAPEAAPAAAPTIPGTTGDGSPAAPYLLDSAADLAAVADAVNTAPQDYAAASYRLSADIALDGAAFVGLDTFRGEFDGAGHTISDLTYAPSTAGHARSRSLAFFRELTDATVRDLTLEGVTAVTDSSADRDWAAGLALVTARSSITGSAVVDAEIGAPQGEKAAGLVAEMDGGLVQGSWVEATVTARRMPGGVAAYTKNGARITENLVAADLTVGNPGGTRGDNAGMVVSYPGNPGNDSRFTANVVRDGAITYGGTVDGFAGRVVGYTALAGWSAASNLAASDITIGGAPVAGPGTRDQHGTDATTQELADPATYSDLGWDLEGRWRWDEERGHPVPAAASFGGESPNRITTTFHGDTSTGRAFTWYSSLPGEHTVHVSADRAFPAGAATREFPATAGTSRNGETVLRAVATDLEPGREYFYRVGEATAEVWSDVGTFTTAPGEGDFSFVALTDTDAGDQAGAERGAGTMAAALAAVPDAAFLVHSGDLVGAGDREQAWSELLDEARPSLTSTTLAPAAGGNEAASGAFRDHFTLETPADQDDARGSAYSFGYNGAHVMVLNTNDDPRSAADGGQLVTDAQLAWLRRDAAAAREAGAQWLILSMHRGAYSTGARTDAAETLALRRALMPVVAEVGIDLVLQGEDHVMTRTEVLRHDPAGVEQAAAVPTTSYTEIVGGKRIEWDVDPDGTIFLTPQTAGAAPADQKLARDVSAFDLESYLQLFDRTGPANSQWRDTRNFAGVTVTDDELRVDLYDVRGASGSPRIFESFGIDRALPPVEDAIAALPAAAELTAGDADTVREVSDLVAGLRPAQRAALAGGPALRAAEARVRELTGVVEPDGGVLAWAKADATHRQPVTVHNDTSGTFRDHPVQVRLADTPDVPAGSLAVVDATGAPLAVEVESWNPGGTSTVWVRVPELPASSATTVWAYLGGAETDADPADVWEGDYELVEHFAQPMAAGESRVDSTGRATGTLTGADLRTDVSDRGTGEAAFAGSRLAYPGDVGGDLDRISISGLVRVTQDDLAALTGNAPMIAKESASGAGRTTFWQGVVQAQGQLGARLAGNSYEFDDTDISTRHDLAADGEPRLITQVYDGMTYAVFVDGVEVHSRFLEYRTTFGDHRVRTTIGDYDTDDGALHSPFHGTIDEVQIASVAFTPELEAFRYANYLGDAVVVGERTAREGEGVSVAVAGPRAGTEVEAGLVEVTGTLTQRADVTAVVAGEEVLTREVDAGPFALEVPVDATGEVTVELVATSGATSGTAALPLVVSDTVAPQQPEVADTAEGDVPVDGQVVLSATPRTDSRERVDVTFHAGSSSRWTRAPPSCARDRPRTAPPRR
ncbi:DUF2341 domain-containing protein [Litorihabitans aurantiacus]|nr:DUF2341 domain-containing protein [Litorihabitans aurantiacus]